MTEIFTKTLDELKTVYNRWLHIGDDEWYTVEVPLAVAKEREVPGDPIWLYLIAPPGGRKTEQVRAMKQYPRIYTVDSLTTATFISGKVVKDEDSGEYFPIAGILTNINGKVLVIKDFTTILSKPDMVRADIFGQLRAIYDGYFEKAFGTLPEPIRVKATIGLIACVTPIIDRYTKVHSALGERFLKVRSHTDRSKASKRAYGNVEQVTQMRRELSNATVSFLNSLKIDVNNLPKLDSTQDAIILALGEYVTLMRCRLFVRYSPHGKIVNIEYVEPEIPTRVCMQLKKLAMLLAVIRGHDCVMSSEINTLIKVAQDTSLPSREKILSAMIDIASPVVCPDIVGRTKIHRNTVVNELEKMTALDIVETLDVKGVDFYRITNQFLDNAITPVKQYTEPQYAYAGVW